VLARGEKENDGLFASAVGEGILWVTGFFVVRNANWQMSHMFGLGPLEIALTCRNYRSKPNIRQKYGAESMAWCGKVGLQTKHA